MNTPLFLGVEKTIFDLRTLYGTYGYVPYKMNKFEEYDLYVRNKDFLISDSVITFTDTNGRLLALKPDVTLSIVKNLRDAVDGVQKVYYNENVYRVSEGTHAFREIMQTGIECIGKVDEYCLYEVLFLAAKSLAAVSNDWVLDISHLGIVSALLDGLELPETAKRTVIRCIGEKNAHELQTVCAENGVSAAGAEQLSRLITVYGSPETVLPQLETLLPDNASVCQLKRVLSAFTPELSAHLRVDFSVVGNTKYYNGLEFKGFVNGIPDSVLSGGQYDNLMQKLGRNDGAVGFAVYLDRLERLTEPAEPYDIDDVLLYDTDDVVAVRDAVAELAKDGNRVTALRSVSEKLRYRRLWKWENGEVKRLETNA